MVVVVGVGPSLPRSCRKRECPPPRAAPTGAEAGEAPSPKGESVE